MTDEELNDLLFLARWMYLTLGYYGTEFNYDPNNIVRHPFTGQTCSGIVWEGGYGAREAQERVRNSPLFERIMNSSNSEPWPPKVEECPELKGFTRGEARQCRQIADGFIDVMDNARLYEKLFEYFQAEMPYGTQKARTGDPAQWITNRLEEIFS
jgi:hypothetical protein